MRIASAVAFLPGMSIFNSCSSDNSNPTYEDFTQIDFGEGTYRPNPFKFLDDIPPFSWMGMPDSVKAETRLQISFNQDAIRSNSTGSLIFIDSNGNTIPGLTLCLHERPLELTANSMNVVVPVNFTVNPAVGDSILRGELIVLSDDIDEINGIATSSDATAVATWKLAHKTGINWFRWAILLLTIFVGLSLLWSLGYLVYQLIIATASSLSRVSLPSMDISFHKFNKRQKKLKKKKKKKEETLFEKVKKLTSYSDTVCHAIRSLEEARIYVDAHLKEKIINGRPVLTNPEINGRFFPYRLDWLRERYPEYEDWSNADEMGEGRPPRDENGDPFELHHIGQRPDSPLAELTNEQHKCYGNFRVLHTFADSLIDRDNFEDEKKAHWEARFNDFKNCY